LVDLPLPSLAPPPSGMYIQVKRSNGYVSVDLITQSTNAEFREWVLANSPSKVLKGVLPKFLSSLLGNELLDQDTVGGIVLRTTLLLDLMKMGLVVQTIPQEWESFLKWAWEREE